MLQSGVSVDELIVSITLSQLKYLDCERKVVAGQWCLFEKGLFGFFYNSELADDESFAYLTDFVPPGCRASPG